MNKFLVSFAAVMLLALQQAVAQTAKVIDIVKPGMKVFLPAKGNATGRAVVACPGGGYQMRAMAHEGYDWASYFNDRGIALAVVAYTLPQGNPQVPMADVEKAIGMLRDSATVWNINPQDIGIMGASAGGHLASTVATHAAPDTRPNFQILLYPVITMDPSYTHMGSHDSFLGTSPSKAQEELYSNEKQVTSDTPRAVIFFCDDDNVVPPINGVNYYAALRAARVPASLFIYPSGGHGWGYTPRFRYHREVLADLEAWLNSF